jgi:hypothetical protein
MQEFYNKGDTPSESEVDDPLTRPAPAEKRRRRATLSPKGERATLTRAERAPGTDDGQLKTDD